MSTYPFLSEEWVEAAREIRRQFDDVRQAVSKPVRMNQIITDVPFGEGTVDAHLDTSSGELVLDTGHLDEVDVTVTLDYDTAKAIFVDGTAQAGVQAFMSGRVKVEGDLGKLLAAMQEQVAPTHPEAAELARRIQAITE